MTQKRWGELVEPWSYTDEKGWELVSAQEEGTTQVRTQRRQCIFGNRRDDRVYGDRCR